MPDPTSPSILGQETALKYLRAALSQQRIAPAYCFTGPVGIGRSLAARWFTQALFCPSAAPPCGHCSACRRVEQANHPDLLWVEPTYKHKNELLTVTEAIAAGVQRKSPPQIRLEQVRAIAAFAARLPVEAPRSTIAIDGAETLAEAAANALLKTLEEPGQSRIILIASDPAALLSTIVSRCQLVPFRRLSTQQVTDIVSSQQELHGLPPHLLALAQGSPGLALEAIARFRALPPELAEQLQTWPTTVRGSLELGRSIARDLDVPAQLWLIDYLQQLVSQQGEFRYIPKLERARQQLLAFVQPQLVWEIALTP